MSDPTGWFAARPNAPLSTAGALSAVFAGPALLLFVSRPHLFFHLELGKLLLLCAGIGFPMLLLCAGACILLLHCLAQWDKPLPSRMVPGDIAALADDPPLEWASLWTGATIANLIFYSLSAYAVFYGFQLARTLLAFALGLIGLSTLIYFAVLIVSYRHRSHLGRGSGQR